MSRRTERESMTREDAQKALASLARSMLLHEYPDLDHIRIAMTDNGRMTKEEIALLERVMESLLSACNALGTLRQILAKKAEKIVSW